jgi:hypothetical protein
MFESGRVVVIALASMFTQQAAPTAIHFENAREVYTALVFFIDLCLFLVRPCFETVARSKLLTSDCKLFPCECVQ